jgi:hypothetical protein
MKGGSDLARRIVSFWYARRGSILKRPPAEARIDAPTVLAYLHRRPLRQLGWFTESHRRLESQSTVRKQLLLWLYFATLVLFCIKLRILFAGGNEQVAVASSHIVTLHAVEIFSKCISFASLMATGFSAAMTAYYFNQNTRSLIHRYRGQKRRIEDWFESLDVARTLAGLSQSEAAPAIKSEVRERVLAFEYLMIEELLDWISISQHDVIEISL